ncbi:MAG: hypothetical protein ACRDL8_06005 [Solirubrobacteraceae bacterium]
MLDEQKLRRARENLGTKTTRATLEAALDEVNRRAALERGAELIRFGALPMVTPEELAGMRTPRFPDDG